MFYLIQFSKTLTKSPIRSLLFLMVTFSWVFIAAQRNYVEGHWQAWMENRNPPPYFHALISSKENISRVSRKLAELPGVERVNILDEEVINQKVKTMVTGLKLDLTDHLLRMSYSGLKVTYLRDTSARSRELIREYLKRLLGTDNVTIGPIRSSASVQDSSVILLIRDWGVRGTLVLFAVFWILLLASIAKEIYKVSYIVEQFQRKSQVGLKTVSSGVGLLMMIALGGAIAVGEPHLLNVLGVISIIILAIIAQARRFQWES